MANLKIKITPGILKGQKQTPQKPIQPNQSNIKIKLNPVQSYPLPKRTTGKYV